MEIGRLCVKIAGRDANGLCVIVDILDKNCVMIDGNVRRRKCNVLHLEPLDEVLKIKKGASHSEVASEFKKLKLDVWEKKAKKKAVRQESKARKVNVKVPAETAKPSEKPKSEKKEAKPKKK